MKRALTCLLACTLMQTTSHAETITTRNDPVGRSLQQWWDAHTAAGFGALWYENHDGNHSPLPPLTYPTLRHRKPTAEEVSQGRDKGLIDVVRPEPTIGNVSMSGTPEQFGSLPRVFTMDARGSEFLFRQYVGNNLFVYPEHQDYDPGANGIGGYGDLYPVNTPCLLISQGSSGSDMPFVKTMFSIAASLRPEIQQLLIRHRLLMPVLQAVFRQNTTLVQNDADYFTGKAHPPVFPEHAIDELRMATAAQVMSLLSLPPAAFVEVLSERRATAGKDFCERAEITNEAICTTPAFVGRVFRSFEEVYEMKLSAKRSIELEHRDLQYRWVLLQGDPKLVTITPEKDGEEATLRVKWHSPMQAATGIRTHRVDVGVFAGNGLAWSAPAFVSFYMLPNEMRFFDDQGRLQEVLGEAGNPELGLPTNAGDARWLSVIEKIGVVDDELPRKLALAKLNRAQMDAMKTAWQSLREFKKAPVVDAEALRKATIAALAQKVKGRGNEELTLQQVLEQLVHDLADDSELFLSNQAQIVALAKMSPKTTAFTDVQAELKRLSHLGVLVQAADGDFTTAHAPAKRTACDRYCLRQLNLTVLSQVLFPGLLERSPAPLFVDTRLATKRAWRDVMRYDDEGHRIGWMRHHQGRMYRFDAEGRLLGEDDKASVVTYTAKDGHLSFEPVAK